jgi:2'-5' RNA ligase
MASKTRRLFAALPMEDPSVASSLYGALNELNNFKKDLKVVNTENYHITMKFMGDVKPDTADKLIESFKKIDPGVSSVPFELKGMGCFPDFSRPSVIWGGIVCDMKPLLEVQRIIEYWSSTFGFDRGKRRFTPHLTLARVKRNSVIESALKDFIANNRETFFTGSLFSECALYESFLHQSGPEYKKLASINF